MEYEIRSLKTRDFFRVSGMLKTAIQKGAKGLDTALVVTEGAAPDEGLEERGKQIILAVLVPLYDYVEKELMEWAADLCGITVDEFLDAPGTLIFDIIDQLSESREASDFFNRALQVSKKASGLVRRLTDVFGLSNLFSDLENASSTLSNMTTSSTEPKPQAAPVKKKKG